MGRRRRRRIPLTPIFEGADAVVHLAWAIERSHDEAAMEEVNVLGSSLSSAPPPRPRWALVYASSVGAYSPARGTSWSTSRPTDGIDPRPAPAQGAVDGCSTSSRGEREPRRSPAARLIFKREAASEIPFFSRPAAAEHAVGRACFLRARRPGLRFQAVQPMTLAMLTDGRWWGMPRRLQHRRAADDRAAGARLAPARAPGEGPPKGCARRASLTWAGDCSPPTRAGSTSP